MSQHTVSAFDADLKELNDLVLDMGRAVLNQHQEASTLPSSRDAELALQRIVEADRPIDEYAADNRGEGDPDHRPPPTDGGRPQDGHRHAEDRQRSRADRRSRKEQRQAHDGSGHAFAAAARARPVSTGSTSASPSSSSACSRRSSSATTSWRRRCGSSDVEIDTLQTSMFRELLTYMMEDPRNIGHCTHLLFCARNLERIGDHATNIAEQVHYIVTGRTMPTDRPKGDATSGPQGDV